ncbi:CRAL/TRIO domain-containing protein [Exidia glandulosa HHB12029]|uniref:CRAL/TRIO domain-containing protein n=1 Tax=Exidia glandulosa HHB12029 TaxID=1314781 RepID=A0A165LZB3_EXIGL|nr:CRAL/TRIO domain-containing protein [Exidia glandulosa HHB12029]
MAASTTDAAQASSALAPALTSAAEPSPPVLSGHVGHLDEHQTAQLAAFKAALVHDGLYRSAIPGTTVAASHDDGTLLRFLRARKFSLPDALQQFRETAAWRKRNNLEGLYESIDIKEFDETRRLYTHWTGRRDRRGVPVYLFRVADLDSKTMAAYEKSTTASSLSKFSSAPTSPASSGFFGGGTAHEQTPARMLRLFATFEHMIRFVMPLCSIAPGRPNPESPITQSNNIVDISNVGLRQFWNLRSHMQDASTLATAHYPETLGRIFVVGAPSFFPTVWGWIKKWFDPITTSKIFILPSGKDEIFNELNQFIDADSIPTQYGGTLTYEFGEMPKMDTQLTGVLRWAEGADTNPNGTKTFPIGPVLWEHTGAWEAIGVGSVDGAPRRVVVARLDEGVQMFGEEVKV